MSDARREARIRKHERIRKYLSGTAARPRLCIFRSLNNLSAQLVDDTENKTLFSVSTLDKDFKKANLKGGNVKSAVALGVLLAKKALEKGITNVVFDRGGYLYHGRVKSFADSARKSGLKF
jgi:large subunit ribosomal protein L18